MVLLGITSFAEEWSLKIYSSVKKPSGSLGQSLLVPDAPLILGAGGYRWFGGLRVARLQVIP